MNYINKFETTEEFNQAIGGGGQLSDLEHFIAYDAQADKIHVKPKPNYFIVTTNESSEYSIYLRLENGEKGNNIPLNEGENKIQNANYGFYSNDNVHTKYSSNITAFDFSNYNTNNIIKMNEMFIHCTSLKVLDLSNFNTSNVSSMENMFSDCSGLTSLNLSNFNTSNVTNINGMFSGCTSLESLDLGNFNTSNVTIFNSIFTNCSSLKTLDLHTFDTSNVTNNVFMFSGCTSLETLDLSNFNTSKMTFITSMFDGCSSLKSLDLSNFDMSKIKYKTNMFNGCSKLSKIKCKQSFKDWCITNKDTIKLPDTMVNGTVGAVGSGSNWEIVDYQS